MSAPNPFSSVIPNLQIAWDSTSMGLLKECPRKYQYMMLMNYQPRGSSLHLSFGIAYHSALELFTRTLITTNDFNLAQLTALNFALSWDETPYLLHKDFNLKNRKTLSRTVVWWTEHYKEDTTPVHILDNGSPAVELSFRLELDKLTPDGSSYLLCGHLDRVVELAGDLWFLDYKTTKSPLTDHYYSQYNPSNQMSTYFAAAQVVLHREARGGIIDAVQLLVGGSRFDRRPIRRTPNQLTEWHSDLHWWLDQALRFAETNIYPMNDKSCGNYGGCPFISICSKDPRVRSHFLEGEFERWEWNPLITRDI